MSVQQKSLVLLEPHGKFVVQSRDIPHPGPGEVLVEVHSTALNPVEWKIQAFNLIITEYPAVFGNDAAGVVKKVGEGVTNVVVGDRVLHQGTFSNRHATHQQYTIIPADLLAKIPSHLTFDQAAALPAAVATAALGFYKEPGPRFGGFGLTAPWDGGRGKYAGQPILIIGGAGSVGQQAIQFAKISGFSPIISTASKHNETYLKSIGATNVLDRNEPLSNAVKEVTSAPIKFVFDAVALSDTQNAAYEVLAPGGILVHVLPLDIDKSKISGGKVTTMAASDVQAEAQRTAGTALYKNLTALLEAGEIKPNNVEVLPGGLAGIPEGVERLKSGKVSALKLVAHPQETV